MAVGMEDGEWEGGPCYLIGVEMQLGGVIFGLVCLVGIGEGIVELTPPAPTSCAVLLLPLLGVSATVLEEEVISLSELPPCVAVVLLAFRRPLGADEGA